ncbi:MAG: carbohydrate binding domain-containing protein, partial [Pirellulaceae bacterium]|nr:carbohydrate binding domain-containing protein [Pirellulaceae bacterium]
MRTALSLTLGFMLVSQAHAEPASITVRVNEPGPKISPMLWGIFFEDINLSADGGIYPEQVRNRNFEDSDQADHWTVVSSGRAKVELGIDREKPVSPKNPRSLKVAIAEPGNGRAGVANGGFYGMGVVKGDSYALSFDARGEGGFAGPLTVTLESTDGLVYAQEKFSDLTPEWSKFTATLTATLTDPKARLVVSADQPGTFWLDMVSLMPKKTWKGHGLRPDLMEMLVGLQPAFNRFPGGCWVEGDTMKEAYRWKQTIGDPSERRTQHNIWGYEATHGVGYHEYLVMCEDLGCEPLFVINCGMSHKENVPLDKMDEFVQDALDAGQQVGRRARQGRSFLAVQPEVPRNWQRERRASLPRTLAAVCQSGQSALPGYETHRQRLGRLPDRRNAGDRGRALLQQPRVLHA